jgi:hypothetical protein
LLRLAENIPGFAEEGKKIEKEMCSCPFRDAFRVYDNPAFPVDAFDDIADPLHAILLLRQRRQGLLQFKALKIQCRVTRNRPIGLSPVT